MDAITLNARYGYQHKLTPIAKNTYRLDIDPKSSGCYRIGYDTINGKRVINFVDPDGGPFLSVGSTVAGIPGKISVISNLGIIYFE